jgi:hypothetical protein
MATIEAKDAVSMRPVSLLFDTPFTIMPQFIQGEIS